MNKVEKIKSILFFILFVVIVGGGFYLIVNKIQREHKLCLAGQIENCTDREWCELQGGRYFGAGFGASRCEYPNSKKNHK